VFSGPRADYDVAGNRTLATVNHARGDQTDGNDRLLGIERIQFADEVVTFAAGNTAATGTVTISDTTPAEDQALTADTTGIGAGLAGLGTLIALSVISLAVTLGRRAHARRRVEARITARLASFGAPSGPGEGPRSVEHEGRTLS